MANNYEVLFIINPTLAEDEIKAAQDKFINLIKENGEIQEINEWGKRRLAYPINDIQDGYYVLVTLPLTLSSLLSSTADSTLMMRSCAVW